MNYADNKGNDSFRQSGSRTWVCIIVFMLICELKRSLKRIIYISFHFRYRSVTPGHKTMILKKVNGLLWAIRFGNLQKVT